MTDKKTKNTRPFTRKSNRDILKGMLSENYSVVEIAEHFGLSVQGVHSTIRKMKINSEL